MSRRAARFTEADLKRAQKIADLSPIPKVVEILPDGTIRLTPSEDRPKPYPKLVAKRDFIL